MLRIALIAHAHFPIREPFAGGIEAHVFHLARALVARGHAVTLFAAPGTDLGCGDPALTIRELPRTEAASLPWPLPGAVKESHHRAFTGLMADLAAAEDSFDVVHNHSLNPVPVRAATRLRAPVLTTLHTPPFPMLEAAVGAVARTRLMFAAVSERSAASWAHVGIRRLTVVRNGIDVEGWPLGAGGDHLVWSGRIMPEKAPHLAIDAAQRAGRRLVLAGPVSDPDYFRLNIEPRLDERVTYAGHLDREELAVLIGGAAAALVTPVWDEPYGQVAAEAMACGTPVVAFATGGLPELVDERCGCLVPPGDVDAMADAVADAARLSRPLVRKVAVAEHGLAAMVDNYVTLYQALVAERGSY